MGEKNQCCSSFENSFIGSRIQSSQHLIDAETKTSPSQNKHETKTSPRGQKSGLESRLDTKDGFE